MSLFLRRRIPLNLPIGDWLIFSLGILALVEWENLRIEPYLKFLPFTWIIGWILELFFMTETRMFYWHFSRILVMVAFIIIAWRRTQKYQVH